MVIQIPHGAATEQSGLFRPFSDTRLSSLCTRCVIQATLEFVNGSFLGQAASSSREQVVFHFGGRASVSRYLEHWGIYCVALGNRFTIVGKWEPAWLYSLFGASSVEFPVNIVCPNVKNTKDIYDPNKRRRISTEDIRECSFATSYERFITTIKSGTSAA